MRRAKTYLAAVVSTSIAGVALPACTAGEAPPTKGSYTIQFPSTAAAVATDFVQIFVFDVAPPQKRGELCENLISARITDPAGLRPSVNPPSPAANICEMRAGRKPVTVPYGEHALLAVAQKKDGDGRLMDFLIGCAIMTVGDGDAPLPIPVRLVSLKQPVPITNCGSVGEYCEDRCD